MSEKLQGKVSIVTGAASGICRETALLLAREGSRVVVADVDSLGGEETVTRARGQGGEALFIQTDVSRPDQVQALVDKTLDAFGKLDVLVNGAARQVPAPPLAEVTEEEWDLVLDINIKGVFLSCKYAIPAMLQGGGGTIVNVASSVVLRGGAFSLPYAVSKAGVVQLTKTASSQYCSLGIRANCVIPGLIDSPGAERVEGRLGTFDQVVASIPVGRVGQPEDVAGLILYLASEDSSYVSGSCFVIDGGHNAK